MKLLQLTDLTVRFPDRQRSVNAVDRLSLELNEGEIYGLVGESGCGKSTTARTVAGLYKASSGKMFFSGEELTGLSRRNRKNRMKDIQMIFQDPYSSLNPRKNVWNIIAEPIRNYEKLTKAEELERVRELICRVGLHPEAIDQYPHQFSGGQRQRIGIARALALRPKLLIADEPVSALDVSVQAQVLNFMKEIQREYKLTILFISHDLGIVRHMCDRVGIMYKGRLVEEGTVCDIFERPAHLYTKRLLAAMPEISPERREEKVRQRLALHKQFEENAGSFFDEADRVPDLRRITDSHSAAVRGGGTDVHH